MIVLDTHFWIWFNVGDPQLTEPVSSEIGRDTILSAASIWEVMLLIEKGRLASTSGAEETVRAWLRASPMRVVPIDEDIAMASRTLKFVHEDPADRYIAATAYIAKAPLATVDARLRCLEWLRTLG